MDDEEAVVQVPASPGNVGADDEEAIQHAAPLPRGRRAPRHRDSGRPRLCALLAKSGSSVKLLGLLVVSWVFFAGKVNQLRDGKVFYPRIGDCEPAHYLNYPVHAIAPLIDPIDLDEAHRLETTLAKSASMPVASDPLMVDVRLPEIRF